MTPSSLDLENGLDRDRYCISAGEDGDEDLFAGHDGDALPGIVRSRDVHSSASRPIDQGTACDESANEAAQRAGATRTSVDRRERSRDPSLDANFRATKAVEYDFAEAAAQLLAAGA